MMCASMTGVSARSPDTDILYTVNLQNGTMTRVGVIGDGSPITDLAIPASGPSMIHALTEDGRLLRFSPLFPSAVLSDVEMTGLNDGEMLLGIDVRPATGEIFAVGDSSTLYIIDPVTGMAMALGESFSPAIDGMAAYAELDANSGMNVALHGAGYTNSVADAEETKLYAIALVTGSLVLQDPPNDGVVDTVGSLGVPLDSTAGFDIAPSGAAYAARQVCCHSHLQRTDRRCFPTLVRSVSDTRCMHRRDIT
jgi:hypothetical protein